MRFHMHRYKFECDLKDGHRHRLMGYAGNMLGVSSFHFHFFYGVCSYNNHTHYFSGITGMPVKTGNGHIHRMEGIFEMSVMHDHDFDGFTFEEISYFSVKQAESCAQ
jgi:hypothetical protein